MFDDDTPPPAMGDNCPDDVKRDFWKQALVANIGMKAAQAAAKQKVAVFRNVLGSAKKAGVSTAAIINALNVRMLDPEAVLLDERERLKMLDLNGFLPGIRERLLDRMDVAEATTKERHELALLTAHDRGHAAGLAGAAQDTNPNEPGTEAYVQWWEGCAQGQRVIADEMNPNAVPPIKRKVGRPRKVQPEPVPEPAPATVTFTADDEISAEDADAALHEDDLTPYAGDTQMPGSPPSMVA